MDERTEYFLSWGLNAAIAFVLAAATFFILSHLTSSQIFGPDESVYLTKARSWLMGTPADQWGIYRPIGMPVLGWILLHFDDSERFLRLSGVMWGALSSIAIFFLFRRLTNLWVAICVSMLAATSTVFLLQAPTFLDDIPSSALLFLLLLVIYMHYQSAGKNNSIYLAAPLAASAFYMRYGVATMLAVIAVASALILLPRFVKKPDSEWRKLALTGIATFVLFVPHFIYSEIATKSFLGVLQKAGRSAHRAYLGDGLVQYIQWLPDQIGGWAMDISAIVGVAVFIVVACAPGLRKEFPGLLWLGAIGFGSFFLTGLLVHAEQRYIFFPMVLLSGTGIAGGYYLLERLGTFSMYSFLTALSAAVVLLGLQNYSFADTTFRAKENYQPTIAYEQALVLIRKDSRGNCALWTQMNGPQASWYSTCDILKPVNVSQFSEDFSAHDEKSLYSIVGSDLKSEQISPLSAQKYNVQLTGLWSTPDISPIFGSLAVYRLGEPGSSTGIQLIQH